MEWQKYDGFGNLALVIVEKEMMFYLESSSVTETLMFYLLIIIWS